MIAINVLIQVSIMFIIISVGFLCYKIKMINEDAAAQLSNILLLVVNPCLILRAFQTPYNSELAKGLLLSTILAVITHIISIIISNICIKKNNGENYRIEKFAIVYSNCGFMAIPLISAILGDIGVFYSSSYLAVFNFFTWTHGVICMDITRKDVSIKKIFTSAPIISLALGLIFFLTSFTLPEIFYSPINLIAEINTPLAMLITGIYIARTDLLSIFTDIKIYWVSLLRLILVPSLMLLIYIFFDKNNSVLVTIATANIIAASCPSAASTLMMSRRYNLNAEYASKIVTLSTLLSIITLPLMILLLTNLIGIVK